MKNLFKSILATLALAALSLAAQAAGNANGVLVSTPGVSSAGWIAIIGTIQNKPSCNTTNRWSVDMSTNFGRLAYATALTARATGTYIYIEGTGYCTLSGTAEDLSYIRIND